MDLMDIFNEVLTTDRRLSPGLNEKKEEGMQKYEDNTLDISQINYFVNPVFASGKNSKPFIVSSEYKSRKKQSYKNSEYLDELKHLLALSEIRYIENVNKLKEAIVINKKLYYMKIINYIKRIYPALKKFRNLILKIYLYKWYSKFNEPEINSFRYLRKQREKKKAEVYKRFKLRSLILVIDQINKVNTLKAFIIFRERGIMHEFGIQYYGVESIAKKKLNKFVLPHKKEDSIKVKLKKLGVAVQPEKRTLNRIKSYFK